MSGRRWRISTRNWTWAHVWPLNLNTAKVSSLLGAKQFFSYLLNTINTLLSLPQHATALNPQCTDYQQVALITNSGPPKHLSSFSKIVSVCNRASQFASTTLDNIAPIAGKVVFTHLTLYSHSDTVHHAWPSDKSACLSLELYKLSVELVSCSVSPYLFLLLLFSYP